MVNAQNQKEGLKKQNQNLCTLPSNATQYIIGASCETSVKLCAI